jgi:hypothetical protein
MKGVTLALAENKSVMGNFNLHPIHEEVTVLGFLEKARQQTTP